MVSMINTRAHAAGRLLALLSSSLGILAGRGGRWTAGLRDADTAAREELDDDRYHEGDLIATPAGQAEPGFVVKVSMPRLGVWRRLRLHGELTVYGRTR